MKVNIRADLERLSTQQLDEILQQEVSKQQPEPLVIDESVRNAWERYRKNDAADQEKAAKRKRLFVTKVAAIAASAALLIMTVPQAVGAKSVFEIIVQWTESIFSFSEEPEEEYVFRTDHPGLQQVYDAVAETGFDKPVVPTWLPEGSEIKSLEINKTESKTKISAQFIHTNMYAVVTIVIESKNNGHAYAKDLNYIKIRELSGVQHYIMSNDGTWTASWVQDRAECCISIADQEEVLYKILDSIYTMEAQ